MALTIPASQDTIKSFSPVTVPPPPVLALGPGLGERFGCLPGIWTFFREKHRWPISLIQALSKEWLYHSHPGPRLMEPTQMERPWQLRDLPGRGRREGSSSVPLEFSGRKVICIFPGNAWPMGIQEYSGRGFPILPTTLQPLYASYAQIALKSGWRKIGKQADIHYYRTH